MTDAARAEERERAMCRRCGLWIDNALHPGAIYHGGPEHCYPAAMQRLAEIERENDIAQDQLRADAATIQALRAQVDRLLAGYPDGETPTDIRNLKEGNLRLAVEVEALAERVRGLEAALRNVLGHTALPRAPDPELLRGLLESVARITRAALSSGPADETKGAT